MGAEIEKPLKSANMHEVVSEWDASFVDIEQELLFELILAANYMDIKSLLDLTCAKVASMIKGKTPEEIRKTFNIVNDFTRRRRRRCGRRTSGARRPKKPLSWEPLAFNAHLAL